MTNMPSILLEEVALEHLDSVTGGGIGTTIGSLFGAKGAKWGGMADNIIGMFKGGGGGGGGGGGFNLGSLFGGGAKKTSSGGDTGGGDTGGGGGDTGGGGGDAG